MQEHPLALRFLEHYVRKPLNGTQIDRLVFSPAKAGYLSALKNVQDLRHQRCSKRD
jgi:hypothetical protein